MTLPNPPNVPDATGPPGAADALDAPPAQQPGPGKSPETAWSVKDVALKIKGYIDRLGAIWVEGQVVELNRRPGSKVAYATLRDPDENYSVPLSIFTSVLDLLDGPLASGTRVAVNVKANYWPVRGTLSLQAREIRRLGLGDLLAKIEQLKKRLAAEGLFAASRKRPLPIIPKLIGVIAGRGSDALKDVIVNARLRWPMAQFEVREVAVQGERSPAEVTAALRELDAMESVETIVIARGGGALEDLLGFSDEGLIRAVAAANTPVVSAIGHENDSPLLDLVADVRASTPTDAGKRIVPDLATELAAITQARTRMAGAIRRQLDAEQARLTQIRSRPVLANPGWIFDARSADLASLKTDLNRAIRTGLDTRAADGRTLTASLVALSPQATLNRGYGIVRRDGGVIVRDAETVQPGAAVHIRLARGEFRAERKP
ncbi:MAG: exodeoxyribonuclease VII large subunit [Bifidobacteriaceae bacterium]|jgi:exodeoxyribonuclease VII large subunit|nr:exodeoxyribonuclease VII large subunit [Bifidobacteriaceae bacterium]